MTEVARRDSSAPALPDDYDGSTGLEDVSPSDFAIPRFNIDHDEGVFKNSLTEETFEELPAIILGLIKQRIMWPEKLDNGDKPQCKSPDFEHGFPNMRTDIPKEKQFPWATSNLDIASAVPIEEEGWSSNGHPTIPCGNCIFQQWNKRDWEQPPCSEQHTYPLLYGLGVGTEDEQWLPALLTVQRSAIQNSRKYISFFAGSKTPMYTVYTSLTLEGHTRGKNKYYVPVFKRGEGTPREDWPEFGVRMRTIRTFVRSAPRVKDEDEDGTPSMEESAPEENTPAPSAETKKPGKPAAASKPAEPPAAEQEPAASGTDDDDDLPF